MCDSFIVPSGMVENSPALQCWERDGKIVPSPVGTAEERLAHFQPSLRDLNMFTSLYPALKRWAIFSRLLRRLTIVYLFLAACVLFGGVAATAQMRVKSGKASQREPWWKRAVFYEIYPRSFKDSDGDGVGDLNGITSKLDYLAGLGVDAVWITPFYPSPQVDFGYDVSDYEAVDPQFGTLADFDRLVKEAHRRNIRVVMDMVLNHTSDQHRFFKESRSSRNNPYRDWYVWRDPKPGGGPPNNWYSGFGPTAWTFDEKTGQYYYHFFYPQQPDLNWRNPEVEQAMFKSIRFWLDRGVDGFRLDVINWLFEDPQLRDNPVLPQLRQGSATEHEQELKYNRDLPEGHNVLRRFRRMTNRYAGDRVLIGEIWVPTIEQLMPYYGPQNNEIHLPFNFFFSTEVKRLDAAGFRAVVEKSERALKGRPTTYVLSNHDDLRRAYTRFGDGKHNEEIAKLVALMLLTLRGSPFFYYGEEIGMESVEPEALEEVRDPVGRRYWPGYKGRDAQRRPMQWNDEPNAGFTTGTPWLRLPPGATRHTVEKASADPDSILNFYKRAIALRRLSPALLDGDYASIGDDPSVFAYRRRSPRQTMIVALNMSGERRTLKVAEARQLREALSNLRKHERAIEGSEISLAPYEAVVLEVGR
jgi:alpha-glucosidase